MISRKILLVLILVFSISSVAYAVLPALIFGEVVGAAVESFVIRSVARSVVETIGTAANDASWISNFTAWANVSRSIGSIVLSASATATAPAQTYEVQMGGSPDDLTRAPLAASYYGAYPEVLGSGTTIDGLQHSVTGINLSDADPLIAAQKFVDYLNTLRNTQFQYSSVKSKICCKFGSVNHTVFSR